MKHPTPDEWMSYIYGEMPKAEAQACRAHLDGCVVCRAQVSAWEGTQVQLDAWQLHAPRRAGARVQMWSRWAVAACGILMIGIMAGRWSGSARPVDLDQLQAQLQPWIKQQVQGSLTDWTPVSAPGLRSEPPHHIAEAWQALDKARVEDHHNLVNLITQVDRRQRQESSNLRKDLETVAMVAEGRLLKTQEDLGLLASYTQNTPYHRTPVPDRIVHNPKPME